MKLFFGAVVIVFNFIEELIRPMLLKKIHIRLITEASE